MDSKVDTLRLAARFAAYPDKGNHVTVAMEAGAEAIELLEWFLANQSRVVIMASEPGPFIVQLDRQTVGRFDTRIDCLRRAKKVSEAK